MEAVKDAGVDTSHAVLKGRSNYACLHRIRAGVPDDQGALIEAPVGSLGQKVLELRAWAEEEAESGGTGERDRAPRHTDREWRQVSVGHRDCLGAARCPFGQECFVEVAREQAHQSHLVVTNHSLLAIDAIEGVPMIPDYDVVVIDEAHELVARVTQAATDELAVADVERAARRSQRHVDGDEADRLAESADALADAVATASPGRFDTVPEQMAEALALVRDAARACLSAYPRESDAGEADAGKTQAKGSVQEVFTTAERMAKDAESDVLWLSEGGDRFPPRLCVAPLEVWGPMRDKLLSDKTVVMTSATLMLGGDFSAVASSVGPQARGARRPRRDRRRGGRGRRPAMGRPRRRLAVRLRPAGDPLRRAAPAAARAATASGPRRSTRSSTSSTPSRAARSASSPRAARPRRRPRRCASGCPT